MKITALLFAAALILAGPARDTEISGRVLDEEGKPVAGVDIADYWSVNEGKLSPTRGFRTDEEGKFRGSVRYYNRPIAVLAVDGDRKRGGVAVLDKESIGDPVEITLRPLVRLHGKFTSEKLGEPVKWSNTMIYINKPRVRLLQCSSSQAEFSLPVPPGEYWFWAYGTDVQRLTKIVTVDGEEKEIDMGTIDLEPTIIAQHYGKAPPEWNVTDARGAEKDVALSDYKGKWVLLEFWGFW